MVAPGWYHAEGDPAGTTRYWDGTAWYGDNSGSGSPAAPPSDPAAVGQPAGSPPAARSAAAATIDSRPPSPSAASGIDSRPPSPSAASGIVYYESGGAHVDLGEVATRVSVRTEVPGTYGQSPYSVTNASPSLRRRKPVPEGLKNLTIVVCAAKAIPMTAIVIGLSSLDDRYSFIGQFLRRSAPPGIDFDTGRSTAVTVMVGLLLVIAGLLITQARAALNDRVDGLLAPAAALLSIDLFISGDQWFSSAGVQSAGHTMSATVAVVLQAWIVLWTVKRIVRRRSKAA